MQTEYIRVISEDKLIGRRNCEICYVRCEGDYDKLYRIAEPRGIVLTPMSTIMFDIESRSKKKMMMVMVAPEQEKMIEELSKVYATSLVLYGVDIRGKLKTATQISYALSQAYLRGRDDERKRVEEAMEKMGGEQNG